jgi:hypothetical protein
MQKVSVRESLDKSEGKRTSLVMSRCFNKEEDGSKIAERSDLSLPMKGHEDDKTYRTYVDLILVSDSCLSDSSLLLFQL